MGRMSTHVLAARCTVCLKVDDPLWFPDALIGEWFHTCDRCGRTS